MTNFDEQTAEELDEQNQQLMQDLHRLYSPRTRNTANSLAHVRHSVFKNSYDTIPISSIPQPSQKIRPAMRSKHLPFPSRRQNTRYRHLNNIAAIFFATLLTGSLVALLMLVRHNGSTGGNVQQSYSTSLQGIHMIDDQNGWAFSSATILRTSDGGIHWSDVTPRQMLPFPTDKNDNSNQSGTPLFMGASTVWIPVTIFSKVNANGYAPTATSFVLHTNDGGQTWQQTTLQTDGYAAKKITFSDTQHGWLLTIPYA
ncbi:MAG TPA: hypothetical protein VGN34_05060, partial [Ktedonobacteraceae bacterium]